MNREQQKKILVCASYTLVSEANLKLKTMLDDKKNKKCKRKWWTTDFNKIRQR